MNDTKEPPTGQIGARGAGALALVGILLLMGFSLAVALLANDRRLAWGAGIAAVGMCVLLVRTVVVHLGPTRPRRTRGTRGTKSKMDGGL